MSTMTHRIVDRYRTLILLSGSIALAAPAPAQGTGEPIRVRVQETLDSLVQDEDTDNDRKITIDDPHVGGTSRGDKRFWLTSTGGRRFEVSGTYYLANLLQELTLANESGSETAVLEPGTIFEPPADRIGRMISRYFWDGLTRHVDAAGLTAMLRDDKTSTTDGRKYVYVPRPDTAAFAYFPAYATAHPDLNVSVVSLPDRVTPEYVRSLDGRHGLLTLALRPSPTGGVEGVTFVVPGGRFNEMYGWDGYFIALGLLHDGRVSLARSDLSGEA